MIAARIRDAARQMAPIGGGGNHPHITSRRHQGADKEANGQADHACPHGAAHGAADHRGANGADLLQRADRRAICGADGHANWGAHDGHAN